VEEEGNIVLRSGECQFNNVSCDFQLGKKSQAFSTVAGPIAQPPSCWTFIPRRLLLGEWPLGPLPVRARELKGIVG